MSDTQKNAAQIRKEELFEQKKNGWLYIDETMSSKIAEFAEQYKNFINCAKTEREAAQYAVHAAEQAGFTAFDRTQNYVAGDRVYLCNRGKAVILAVIGKQPVVQGVRIAAAHIDSPRLDLKQHPLYEDSELALFKTHYYGGIRKYQWPTVPLSLHRVIVKRNGEKITVNIGEDASDPCFVVTDLLPHLAVEQSKRTLSEGIKGEELNILIGSRPFNDDKESEQVKLNVMHILNQKYGITEADFVSAELEAVPAYQARDIGFDRSMIGAYGHDDRVCAYPAMMAALGCTAPEKTVITVLADKEEIGSDGNTGLNSSYLAYFINDLARMQGSDGWTVLSHSECLSADVSAAWDPTFPDVMERRNAAAINGGVCVMKYTGARGKSDTSDASAEYTGRIRNLLEDHHVVWQTSELGKVDNGGGGTVAKYIANLDVDVIDIGVPVLSMHSPFEIISKLDLYMTYQAIAAFYAS